jgi:ComF family protein
MAYPGPHEPLITSPILRQASRILLDTVFPRICTACEAPMEGTGQHQGIAVWLCQACMADLEPIEPPYCSVCGESFGGRMTREFRCSNCDGRRMAFDFALSAFKAHGVLRELIHHFKYGRDLSLRGVLAEILKPAMNDPRLAGEDLSKWVLVPVPLHFLREMRREFNQSWELCRMLAGMTGIPAVQALRRTRFTSTQAKLHRQQRLDNLRGVFALRRAFPWRPQPDLNGRKILLVDDVLTTGATAHECAKILKRDAGAEKVVVITAARG